MPGYESITGCDSLLLFPPRHIASYGRKRTEGTFPPLRTSFKKSPFVPTTTTSLCMRNWKEEGSKVVHFPEYSKKILFPYTPLLLLSPKRAFQRERAFLLLFGWSCLGGRKADSGKNGERWMGEGEGVALWWWRFSSRGRNGPYLETVLYCTVQCHLSLLIKLTRFVLYIYMKCGLEWHSYLAAFSHPA